MVSNLFALKLTVFRLSGQSLDCLDSFWIIKTVSELSGLSGLSDSQFLCLIRIFAEPFQIVLLLRYHALSDSGSVIPIRDPDSRF